MPEGDHKQLLTQVIKKQMVILGPDITLAKARNVQGLTVTDDGTVTAITGDPQEVTKQLVNQFMELSGLIVKKTMEPLLASFPGLAAEQTASPQPLNQSGSGQAPTTNEQPKVENQQSNNPNPVGS